MVEQNFVDYVKINCRSGAGGAGAVHFRREAHVPRGGPDGGDGGRGGDIIIKGNKQLWTLLHLKYRKHVVAGDGQDGGKNNKKGADGSDEVLEVPIGTVARHFESGEKAFEITEHGETHVLMKGGKGGKGNTYFKTSTRQAPKFAQPGEEGQEEWMVLELKLLADVGLVGFPNAGKSTLLSVLSAAKPKIANYPFTTLVPNLGIVAYRDYRSFVMADLPGIIEDAHKGRGLGDRFLRHIERNSVLLLMIPCDADNIQQQYETLLHELGEYKEELLHKPRVVALTKSDVLDDELKEMIEESINLPDPHIFISSVSEENLLALKDLLWKTMENFKQEEE